MQSLDLFARNKLADLDQRSLRRRLVDQDRQDAIWIERDGRRLLSFSCNDYLNLSQHPLVKASAIAAVERWGVGSCSSRLVTGNHPLYSQLETRLAELKGAEAACVFGAGYLANTGIIPALVGKGDLIVLDELAHACIWAGARMSGATVLAFRHNDVEHAAELLTRERARHRHALLATDGVFSMDGDLAPVPALAALAQAHDAWLMTDDAHGIGVLGGGRGSSYAFAAGKPSVPLQMGTLSKAVGGYGGYLCASAPVIDLIKTRARTVIYSTGLPPATVAAALTALEIIAAEPELCARPVIKARRFTRRLGLPDAESPIVPLILGSAEDTLAAQQALADAGFLVTAIRAPTVPEGTARLRITFTAAHSDESVDALADVIAARVLKRD